MMIAVGTLTTPAGTFETVVVEQRETGSGSPWAKRTFWYAPDPRLIVKSTFTLERTGGGTSTLVPGDYQAVRIEVPGGTSQP